MAQTVAAQSGAQGLPRAPNSATYGGNELGQCVVGQLLSRKRAKPRVAALGRVGNEHGPEEAGIPRHWMGWPHTCQCQWQSRVAARVGAKAPQAPQQMNESENMRMNWSQIQLW